MSVKEPEMKIQRRALGDKMLNDSPTIWPFHNLSTFSCFCCEPFGPDMGLVRVLDVLVKNCQETGNEEETPEWFEFVRCQKQLDIMIWRVQWERVVICKFYESSMKYVHVIDDCRPHPIACPLRNYLWNEHGMNGMYHTLLQLRHCSEMWPCDPHKGFGKMHSGLLRGLDLPNLYYITLETVHFVLASVSCFLHWNSLSRLVARFRGFFATLKWKLDAPNFINHALYTSPRPPRQLTDILRPIDNMHHHIVQFFRGWSKEEWEFLIIQITWNMIAIHFICYVSMIVSCCLIPNLYIVKHVFLCSPPKTNSHL